MKCVRYGINGQTGFLLQYFSEPKQKKGDGPEYNPCACACARRTRVPRAQTLVGERRTPGPASIVLPVRLENPTVGDA
jgi:hypothetical protein